MANNVNASLAATNLASLYYVLLSSHSVCSVQYMGAVLFAFHIERSRPTRKELVTSCLCYDAAIARNAMTTELLQYLHFSAILCARNKICTTETMEDGKLRAFVASQVEHIEY